MIRPVKILNRSMVLASAPFLGIIIWMISYQAAIIISDQTMPEPTVIEQAASGVEQTVADLDLAADLAQATQASIKKQVTLYNKTNADIELIADTASSQVNRPRIIYDRRITKKLGSASGTIQSDQLRAQLFSIQAQNFSGYALKVKLGNSDAMKMVLGNDKFGSSETTMSAVKRYGAIAGVNAGGFADGNGKRYPLSTTVLNGEYLNGFEPSFADLFFVGLSEDNKLIGGSFSSKEQLDKLKPRFGASFVPILLKNGSALPIPTKWQVSPKRAPRTVIANYKDDQLLFLVIDGYNESGSSGATLEELQILLKRFGAKDAYNLDGGGSSSLIFNGRIVNKPSDGQLRSLPTHFLFFK
ncbi:exopolysaccharide biosynthesis protein [Paenibacillus cellulosilyticus]|uniref:Exopolysaccharide biosynthesis protein n=1 Tax=Paenibacillus cellulosilyticus TaxID=375489 RepID=A0A2V2YGY1_9BACL|nr:phosphodiester glycosidase family protein [Paenibacillus cellulosilyticus]PWV92086.1 exopolysaccharide biosynthesis protein [Paenibacillus cellulosilyticus]QKS44196.1 phosphodiester glycosidase family protein [Paenibacillus cellulosilyticus]